MPVTSALLLFAVIWFVVIFVVLPLRLTTQEESEEVVPGTHSGSPEKMNLRVKLGLTTLVAALLWGIVFAVVVSGAVTVRDLDWFNRMDPPHDETGA